MSEEIEEKLEDVQNVDTLPLEVKIVNKDKKEVSDYDSKDNEEYDDLGITSEQIKEFEDGDSSSK